MKQINFTSLSRETQALIRKELAAPLKITPQHQEQLKKAMAEEVKGVAFKNILKAAEERKRGAPITTLEKIHGLYSATMNNRSNGALDLITKEIYKYADDSHIDTLLKKWAKEDTFNLDTKVEARERRTLSESFLQHVAENTSKNLHTENLVLIAKETGDKKLLAAADGVLALHKYFGQLTPDLSKVREDLYKSIEAVAYSVFSNAEQLFSNL